MQTRCMVASVARENSSSSSGVRSPTLFVITADAVADALAAGVCWTDALAAITAPRMIAAAAIARTAPAAGVSVDVAGRVAAVACGAREAGRTMCYSDDRGIDHRKIRLRS